MPQERKNKTYKVGTFAATMRRASTELYKFNGQHRNARLRNAAFIFTIMRDVWREVRKFLASAGAPTLSTDGQLAIEMALLTLPDELAVFMANAIPSYVEQVGIDPRGGEEFPFALLTLAGIRANALCDLIKTLEGTDPTFAQTLNDMVVTVDMSEQRLLRETGQYARHIKQMVETGKID